MWFILCNFAADLQTTREETTETNPRGESKWHNYAVKRSLKYCYLIVN